jgi:Fibronectin type III domain
MLVHRVTSPPAGAGIAEITWNAPAENNAVITGYRITYTAEDPAAAASDEVLSSDGAVTAITISGLVVTQQYTFQVFATNRAGEGPGSASSAVLTVLPGLLDSATATLADPVSTLQRAHLCRS